MFLLCTVILVFLESQSYDFTCVTMDALNVTLLTTPYVFETIHSKYNVFYIRRRPSVFSCSALMRNQNVHVFSSVEDDLNFSSQFFSSPVMMVL